MTKFIPVLTAYEKEHVRERQPLPEEYLGLSDEEMDPTLAGEISKHPDAEFIVFCGVHFMAESADVLCAPHQQVILPDLAAGCSMSDMADPDQLASCWEELGQ